MNLFELLFFTLLSAGLLVLGHYLAGRWGPFGWLVGFVPVGLAWGWVLFGIIKSLFTELRHSLMSRPVCRQGKCQSRNHLLIESASDKAVFRCRCGDRYLFEDGHFSELLTDGSVRPFETRFISNMDYRHRRSCSLAKIMQNDSARSIADLAERRSTIPSPYPGKVLVICAGPPKGHFKLNIGDKSEVGKGTDSTTAISEDRDAALCVEGPFMRGCPEQMFFVNALAHSGGPSADHINSM